MKHYTRFRAYQLSDIGSSYSLSVDNHFTLIEARLNKTNGEHILYELRHLGKETIDVLHITSWDEDHCKEEELKLILEYLKPSIVEYPSYLPDSDSGKKSLNAIKSYKGVRKSITPYVVECSKNNQKELFAQDLFYNPIENADCHNDNSVIKFFRIGTFTILSLGDCESDAISNTLMNDKILQSEVDVLLLAHHGSKNSICSMDFLRAINPKIAICSSNYDNKFEHPDDVIRQRLSSLDIPLMTTKTGDIVVQSIDKYSFKVSNYISNNEHKDDTQKFTNKTYYIYD